MNAKLLVSTACGVAAGALACASPPNPNVQRAEVAYDAAANDPRGADLRSARAAGGRRRARARAARRAARRGRRGGRPSGLSRAAARRDRRGLGRTTSTTRPSARRWTSTSTFARTSPPRRPAHVRIVVRTPIYTDLDATLLELHPEQTDRGVVIVMDDVWFDRERSTLRPDALPDLSRLADYLRSHRDLDVIVEGHADRNEVGHGAVDLSEDRAEAVEDYFKTQGIDDDRVLTRAYGASAPRTAGATPFGRQQNRRVEIVVVE